MYIYIFFIYDIVNLRLLIFYKILLTYWVSF
jgi:hypothetical protein